MFCQASAGYRELRDLNFSDHVKCKKALKLYIILILKTIALKKKRFFFGLKLTRYYAIDITLWQHTYFSNFIDLTQRIFGLFEQNTKIHISQSMGRILTNNA